MATHELGDLDRTRSPEQRAAYARSIAHGVCPFCGPTEEMPEEIRTRMIFEYRGWRAWHNPFPYSGHAEHVILAPVRHATQPSELEDNEMRDWFKLNAYLITSLKLPGGGLVMRFGDHEYKGGSITHLHSHIQVPNFTSDKCAIAVFRATDKLKKFFAEEAKK